jgi:hypothetical protein
MALTLRPELMKQIEVSLVLIIDAFLENRDQMSAPTFHASFCKLRVGGPCTP